MTVDLKKLKKAQEEARWLQKQTKLSRGFHLTPDEEIQSWAVVELSKEVKRLKKEINSLEAQLEKALRLAAVE